MRALWVLCGWMLYAIFPMLNGEESLYLPDQVIDVPMRDGVMLPANVFLPPREKGEAERSFPCVLVRHPLGKDVVHRYPDFPPHDSWLALVKKGYALVVQSTRSICDPTGKSIPYLTDGWSEKRRLADGYDTVQWLASANFCNGSISTVGSSATGITQLLLAPAAPPNLSCQYIEMAPPSMYQYAVYPGGQFRKEQVEGWLQSHQRHPSIVEWLKGKSRYDSFWGQFNALEYADHVRVPQFHMGGWFDIFLQGTIDAFFAAQQYSQSEVRQKHRLIIGPWGHRWKETNKLGDFTLTKKQKTPPVNITEEKWLDFHVRNVSNGLAEAPSVQYYVMGPFDGSPSKGHCWRTAQSWPPQGVKYQSFYLRADSKLAQKKQEECEPTNITFDAKNPVPSIGGRNLFLPDGPRDIQQLVSRSDTICYTSDLLEEDVEVTGRLWANMYLSDLAHDRDICLRLVDIWPSGEHYLVVEGVSHVSARQQDKGKDPQLVVVDLWSTSMVFAKGHKIGLLISASNYPAYETSFVADETQGTAFKIHATEQYPSSLELPLFEEEKKVVSTEEREVSSIETAAA